MFKLYLLEEEERCRFQNVGVRKCQRSRIIYNRYFSFLFGKFDFD